MTNQVFTNLSPFIAALPERGRLLGIDQGKKRIGIALSDGMRMVATPQPILQVENWGQTSAALRILIETHTIGGLVIGYPLNMDGSAGPRVQSARQFARNIAKIWEDMPILLWDERLSTAAAERAMLEADLSRQKRMQYRDSVAASYILQGVLDAL